MIPNLSTLFCTATKRSSLVSTAITGHVSAICVVFDPGAAQASKQSFFGFKTGTGS